MTSDTCFCGEELGAVDFEGLVETVIAHFDAVHPEVGLKALHARDYLEAKERLSSDVERRPRIGPVEILDVERDRIPDILAFFDRDAFAGNPAWAACYCMFHHVGSDELWTERDRRENRAEIRRRLHGGATTGVIATVEGGVVGWCNATERSAFPRHAGGSEPADEVVGSIVCFVVAPPYRGHGVAGRLLGGACDLLRRLGLSYVEAYPAPDPATAESAYRGTVSLYAAAGFRDVGDGVMRRPLG